MAFLPILLLLLNTTLLAYSSDFKFPKETILGVPDANDVVCPDQESHCPTGTTCCMISGGAYGCCPIPRAVCCSDHVHCCPHGYTCDLQHSQCLNEESSQSHPLSRKFPAKSRSQLPQPHHASAQREEAASANTNDNAEVLCPDGHSMCPEHTTCCPIDVPNGGKQFWKVIAMKRSGGQSTRYGCCPAEQAVCCADHMHCCPHRTQCDMQARRCAPQNGGGRRRTESENSDEQQQPLLRHTHRSSKKVAVAQSTPTELMMEPTMQICAKSNGKHHSQVASVCPAGGKCCRHRNPLNGRKWDGCCPFADGQCCAHSGHCCPAGFACGVPGEDTEDRCINEQRNGVTLSTRMVPTVVASKQKANKLNCCNGDGSNQVGAVCCPHGYKCTGAGESPRCEQMNTREHITQLLFGSGGQDEENY